MNLTESVNLPPFNYPTQENRQEKTMANPAHLEIMEQGKEAWDRWREENPEIKPDLRGLGSDEIGGRIELDLSGWDLRDVDMWRVFFIRPDLRNADLRGADLSKATIAVGDLRGANLSGAYAIEANIGCSNFSGLDLTGVNLNGADLSGSDFSGATLSGTGFRKANLSQANFSRSTLIDVDLTKADLSGTIFTHATLAGANLEGASLVSTNFEHATMTNCKIYGISAWNLILEEACQTNLIITRDEEPTITVDNLQIAQFIHLLLNNENVRHIIDTITSKVVLILGRFTDERKEILDNIRNKLREMDLTPILFDFDKPASKDVTGTVETLARMARFIIADLTDPSSIPHELATIIPHLRTTPVLLIKIKGSPGYSMIEDYERSYQWVLKTHEYTDGPTLIAELPQVIAPADEMAEKFRRE